MYYLRGQSRLPTNLLNERLDAWMEEGMEGEKEG